MRSVFLLLAFLGFFVLGAAAPFALTLGYLWVDTFRPQDVSFSILTTLPLSMLVGGAAIGAYALLDRRDLPRPNATILLTLLFAIWVTLTTVFFAVAPEAAWRKWDWAFKTLMFSVFVQFTIRSRVQIEAFLQVYLFAIAAHVLPAGAKTLLGGGGYGQVLGVSGAEYGAAITESSTMAAVSLMMLPILFYFRAHTVILPRGRVTDLLYAGMSVVMLAAAVGTFARTGLVGMAVVGGGMWLRAKRKLLFGLAGAATAVAIAVLSSDSWNARISTIDDYQTESSSLGRILVWQWTLDFVRENPLGGGFESFVVNVITFPASSPDAEPAVQRGKAFHSIYFEVLGEHGWVGLGLFLALIATALLSQTLIVRRTRKHPGLLWARDLAAALQVALITLLACGAFIGIAFLPMLYYLFAITACLANNVRRAIQSPSPAADAGRIRVWAQGPIRAGARAATQPAGTAR